MDENRKSGPQEKNKKKKKKKKKKKTRQKGGTSGLIVPVINGVEVDSFSAVDAA